MKAFLIFFSAIAFGCSAQSGAESELPPFSEGLVLLTDGDGDAEGKDAVRYYISTFDADAYTAYSYCLASGRHLLSIQTDTEQAELERYLEANQVNGYLWTSGTDVSQEGSWLWGTGERILYNNFASGQEEYDHPLQNCLMISAIDYHYYKFQWFKEYCATYNYFICESTV